jgi:hypothetical protein
MSSSWDAWGTQWQTTVLPTKMWRSFLRTAMCESRDRHSFYFDLEHVKCYTNVKKNILCSFELFTEIWFFNGIPKTKLYIIYMWWSINKVRTKISVARLFLDDFPNTTVWHFACHRLVLGASDLVDEVAVLNLLELFCDKLYSLYHRSPRNQDEVIACIKSLHCKLLKTDHVFSVRWVASTHQNVKAMWRSYKPQ